VALTSRRVLIIDDDPEIRAIIAEALSSEGHSVAEAGDGLDGLRSAREHHPDLILLDLMMPRMDGWAFRRAQVTDAQLATIPVVIISAAPPEQVHALDVAAHFHKPFGLDDLFDVIERLTAEAA